FQHLRSDNDRLTQSKTGFHNSALDDRQLLHWAFDSQVASGDHDRICAFDHVADCSDGELVFDFSNDQSLAPIVDENATQFIQITFLTHKAKRDKIDAQFCAE